VHQPKQVEGAGGTWWNRLNGLQTSEEKTRKIWENTKKHHLGDEQYNIHQYPSTNGQNG